MNYLLDTCTLLWFFTGSGKLSKTARAVIEDGGLRKCVSAASLWEFAISCSMGRLHIDSGFPRFHANIVENCFAILPISKVYLEQLIGLPFHHRDPFDRLLVATAKADGMTVLTSDENISKYDVSVVW